MKHTVAETIGRKAKALKHCEKLLNTIDKKGESEILLNNTGVALPVKKDDAIYALLQSIRFKLVHEISSIEIVSKVNTARRMLPAPYGACDETPSGHTCSVCGNPITKQSNRQKYCSECAKRVALERCKEYRRRLSRNNAEQ